MKTKFVEVEVSWTELHTKKVKVPVMDGEERAAGKELALRNMADSCIHYEVHESKIVDEDAYEEALEALNGK